MSKNYCNCPNCQTENCPAGAELDAAKAKADEAHNELMEETTEHAKTKLALCSQQELNVRLEQERDAAKAKSVRLEARLCEIDAACHANSATEVLRLANDVSNLRGALEAANADHQTCRESVIRLGRELNIANRQRDESKANEARLTQENARLAAALIELPARLSCSCDSIHGAGHYDYCAKSIARAAIADSTAIRELLSKAEELMNRAVAVLGPASRLYKNASLSALKVDCERERERLRAAMGGKG